MNFTENENEIVLTDTPIISWIIGSFFLLVCSAVFVFFIYYTYQNPQKFFTVDFTNNLFETLSSFFSFGLILLSFTFLFVLFFSIVSMTKIIIKVNRLEKIVEIRRIGLLKKQIDKYYFPQISRFGTISRPKDGFKQIALRLANGSKINLEIGNLPDEEFSKTLKKLNSFITK